MIAYIISAGSATTFIPTFDLVGLCFHLGTVLFTAYFPFRARTLETKGHYKYLHIVAVVCAVGSSGFLTGIQFGIGGYSRTIVPVFCLASPEGAFGFSIVPVCITCATFLTFVVVLLFKILDLEGWHLKKSEVSLHHYSLIINIETIGFCFTHNTHLHRKKRNQGNK